MQHRATLRYDTSLVKRAVRAYWRKSLGWSVLLGIPVLFVLLALQIIEGDRSWFVGFLGAATLLGIAMPILVYAVHYRNSMAKFRELREPVATFTADSDSFTLASDKGSATLKWDAVKEVWTFEGFWLLLFSRAHFATIPLEDVSEDMRSFVLERVKANGGRISV